MIPVNMRNVMWRMTIAVRLCGRMLNMMGRINRVLSLRKSFLGVSLKSLQMTLSMEYKIEVYTIWEPGQRTDDDGNPHQEDSLYPHADSVTDADRTFVLCDGMGGHDAGEVASATVCEAMARSVAARDGAADGCFTDDDLKRAIDCAYTELDKHDSDNVRKMGTTMTFLQLHRDGATLAHIGDSRLYHIRQGETEADTQILYESEDHSLVNVLIKMGELTREDAHKSPQKNVITRAMQPGETRCKASVYHTSDIKAGDYFYMCSDGMLEEDDMDNGSRLRQIFSRQIESDSERVSLLTAETEGNKDNHTAFIIHVTDVKGSPAQPNGDVGRVVACGEDVAVSRKPESDVQSETDAASDHRMTKILMAGIVALLTAVICFFVF